MDKLLDLPDIVQPTEEMVHDVEFRSALKNACLHVPKGPQRSPGILLLHGSEGAFAGWMAYQALALAMKGFVAFAYPYGKGGDGWHAGDIHDIDLDETVDALRWLREHPAVSGKVGLYGVSRGAEHAILLTSLMVRDGLVDLPDAVAAHSPSDTIAGAFIADEWHPKTKEPWDPSKRAWRWRGSSEGLTPTTPIELERYSGPIFLSHGDKDQVWTVECTRRLEARLRASGGDPEVHYYAGEGHRVRCESRNDAQTRLVSFFSRHLMSRPAAA
jgi:pimeloyl-ACP methyl ester carboxylesterase